MRTSLSPALVLAALWSPAAFGQDTPKPVPATEAPETPELNADVPADLEAFRAELKQVKLEVQRARAELSQERVELERMRAEQRQSAHRSYRDHTSYGHPVIVEEGTSIDEAIAFGDNVRVSGEVNGDATAFGGSVVITPTGLVHGDAVSFGGEVIIEDGGRIEGQKISIGAMNAPSLSVPTDGTNAMGSISATTSAADLMNTLYHRMILLLSFAGAGVLMVGVFPNRVGRIANTLEDHPFRSGFVGVMATGFLTLFSVLFALITLGLGLPVSMVVFAGLALAWMMGFVGLCQAIGDRLPIEQKPHGRWLAFLVGAVLVTCVGSLQWIGTLIVIGASTLGIGAAISSRLGGR